MMLYIHIPFCVKKCNYCDFLSFSASSNTHDQYIDALIRELKYYKSFFTNDTIDSIYIGGGTPTILKDENIERLFKAIYDSFYISDTAEISIECNPATATEDSFKLYRSLKINRVSIGVQSCNENELNILGRIHTYDDFVNTYQYALYNDITNINVDIMTSLPTQTLGSLSNTLKKILLYRPTHVSVYNLIIEPNTLFYENYANDLSALSKGYPTRFLPSEDETLAMDQYVKSTLAKKGYHRYEISNYSKEGYECRHNIGYWKRTSYLGLGLGAASLIKNHRYKNTTDLDAYINNDPSNLRIEDIQLTRANMQEEFFFLGLRMVEGISKEDFINTFNVPCEAIYKNQISYLKDTGYLIDEYGRIALTPQGLDVSNYLLSMFLQDSNEKN